MKIDPKAKNWSTIDRCIAIPYGFLSLLLITTLQRPTEVIASKIRRISTDIYV